MNIDNALKVAEYLGDQKNVILLKQLLNARQASSFYVPFMGQFSTGKSYLINSLLGQPILPVGTLETTSALTKIFHGDGKAEYLTVDGARHVINVEDLQHIRQNAAEFDYENIKEIQLQIENELLQRGLIIVDTPGLNTIIKRHEEFTYEILPAAGAVVYVMDKFLTAKDWEILQDVLSRDIPIALVRTQIDKIFDSGDSSIDEVMAEDRRQIAECLGDSANIRYFAVSAKNPDLTIDDAYCNWNALREYLIHVIGDNVGTIRAATEERRILKIKADLENGLSERRNSFKMQKEYDNQEIEKRRIALEKILDALDSSRDQQKNRVVQEINELKKQARGRLNHLVDASTIKCKCALDNIVDREELYQRGKSVLKEEGQKFTNEATNVLTDILEESTADLQQKYSANIQEFMQENDMESLFMGSSISYMDAEAIKDYIDNQLQYEREELDALEAQEQSKLADINLIQEQWQEENKAVQEAQSNTMSAQNRLDSLTYQPEMRVVPGNTQGSELGRKIGNVVEFVADVVITLGSGGAAAPATAAKTAGKVAVKSAVKGAAKTALKETIKETVKKVGKAAIKVGRAAMKVKKEGDMKGKRNGLWKALDYVDLGEWGAKLGSYFDEPPREEEDPEVRAKYEQAEKELEYKLKQALYQQLQKEEEAGMLKDKMARVQRERDLLQQQKNVLDKRLQAIRRQLHLDFIKNDCQQYRQKLQTEYREILKQLADKLLRHWNEYMSNNLPIIVAVNLTQVEDKIKQQTAEYKSLIAEGEDRTAHFNELQEECEVYSKMLED